MQRLMPFQGWRLTFLQGIVFAVFLIFSVRMAQWQMLESGNFQEAANENRLSELPLPAPRGTISDRFGRMLARNVPAFNVTIVPAYLPDSQEDVLAIYNRLSALTDVPPTRAAADATEQEVRSIEELVAEGQGIFPYRPVTIAQDILRERAMQIDEERYSLPGVGIDVQSVREYPTGALTSQIIGYMGRISPDRELELLALGYNPAYDRVGYAGLEYSLEEVLAGQRGREVTEVDVAGQPLRQVVREDPESGQNITTTIDIELQQAAEDALRNGINQLNATEGRIISQTGAMIALNPQTGEVLALVSWPSYDNSRFARSIDVDYYLDVEANPLTPLVNHTTQSLYPPGSVWKVLTAVGALQEDVIDPNSLLSDPGDLLLPNRYAPNDETRAQRFVCWLPQGHGRLNIIGAIAASCDVFFYQLGGGNPDVSPQVLREGGLGIVDLFRYATAFGIGSRLGIELPFENSGFMPDPEWKRRAWGQTWSTGDTYNAAFGQGYVNVTPLQLINAVAAIANGGTLYQPTIVREVRDSEGSLVSSFEPEVIRTLNLDEIEAGEPIRLLMFEDMIMKGSSSFVCQCEQTSDFFNPIRCNPDTYTNTVNISSDELAPNLQPYTIYVPDGYAFDEGICSELQFNESYQPPFVRTGNIQLVEDGMRFAVTGEGGTARAANLPYVAVAGKTGTAEYCDEIAWPLGLCVQGNWPAHAWFTAYAPYDDPEIIIIAFVYNGGEGSAVALPMVVQTMEAYYRLQNERGQSTLEGIPPASEDLPEGALPTGDLPLVPELPTNGIVPQATPDVSPAGQ
jgi:penicillin-binding protein 2